MGKNEISEFEIRSNAEWIEKGWTAESAQEIRIEESEIPARFRHLIPLAKKWAIPCDVRRGDFFEKQTKEEIAKFHRAVLPFVDEIQGWISQGLKTESQFNFMMILKAHSESYPPPSEKELLERRKRGGIIRRGK